jgi:PGAP1-like protein
MQRDEVTALGELAGDAIAGLTAQIRDMHSGIAARAFRGVGVASEPIQLVHDQVAEYAYGAARLVGSALLRAGAVAFAATQSDDAASIDASLPGRLALGALNGAFGDGLHAKRSALATTMTLRRAGRDVAIDRSSLTAAFPHATPRLALFVHGLCETDDAWKLGAHRHMPYGAALEADLGYTPLYLRYNTGRHISENGRELAQLLDQLTEAWPVEVQEIVMIGHSMGGLVSRSACHYSDGHTWPSKVRHVFTLGTPHRGAPLEKAATVTAAAFARLPETRGFARAVNGRSAGIQDLGHGYLVDEDWAAQDPEAFFKQEGSEIPFLGCANHYFVCATLSRQPDAPAGRIVGDLLVLRPSAWAYGGRGERLRFPVEHYHHVGGASHFDLLNHPAIYAQLRRWLSATPALPEAVAH